MLSPGGPDSQVWTFVVMARRQLSRGCAGKALKRRAAPSQLHYGCHRWTAGLARPLSRLLGRILWGLELPREATRVRAQPTLGFGSVGMCYSSYVRSQLKDPGTPACQSLSCGASCSQAGRTSGLGQPWHRRKVMKRVWVNQLPNSEIWKLKPGSVSQ